ncbi:CopY/TcrY family copper transport repressor [Isobaculum melis]|uniref:Copper transport repressor, CopY/TcrY family n=1 Tax=Isobaculum melis TaxID=142588 RepID=A0A1H9UA18_9LACT|nr:CopY/TcrY family copper transport repressor [Isobaculum melis]SES05994.1 copper transport repressor, CopY/TcrY family [Isobaculum melis]
MQTTEKNKITEAEWEVMRVIWASNEATSQQVIQALEHKYQWKPATIKTLLGRLVKKESLTTSSLGNKFIYHPNITEEETIRLASNNLLAHICHRKVGQTIADLLDQATLSHADVALLEQIIAKKKVEAVDKVPCNCVPGQCACHLTK